MTKPRKQFTKVSLEPEAAQELRTISLKLTGKYEKEISMSAALLLMIESYREYLNDD